MQSYAQTPTRIGPRQGTTKRTRYDVRNRRHLKAVAAGVGALILATSCTRPDSNASTDPLETATRSTAQSSPTGSPDANKRADVTDIERRVERAFEERLTVGKDVSIEAISATCKKSDATYTTGAAPYFSCTMRATLASDGRQPTLIADAWVVDNDGEVVSLPVNK